MADNELSKEQVSDELTCSRRLRQGWRFFKCEECGYNWKETTRDHFSPSGECCPKCCGWCFPYHREYDSSLSVDHMGNLLNFESKEL